MSGKYIVIEGPDGTGKTTQAQLLVKKLNEQGISSCYVHEPGETPMGLELEKIIKNRTLERSPSTDLLLFTANRLEVYRQVIHPALSAGKVVVADRNWLSSVAYQGVAGGLGIDVVQSVTKTWLPAEYINPTFTALLYAPEDQHQQMLGKRGTSQQDYFESKPDEFQQLLNAGYKDAAQLITHQLDSTCASISAGGTIEQVHDRIIEVLQNASIM
jgi:dTMP kinase